MRDRVKHLIPLTDKFQQDMFLKRLKKAQTNPNVRTKYELDFLKGLQEIWDLFGAQAQVSRKQMNYLLSLAEK